MPSYDFTTQRLFVDTDLSLSASADLDRAQCNYLLNVLRMKSGDPVLLFNGRDGEWRASLNVVGRKKATLTVQEQTRLQSPRPDLIYLFAPIKQARMEYMIQKAVEMGTGVLQPVITQHTQQRRVNLDRMRAHSIEAAEQCGVLSVPEIREPASLDHALSSLDGDRQVIFCDESADSHNPLGVLAGLETSRPPAVLIGPEGGFSESEREKLNSSSFVTAIPLGPRILRADTAAVAALAVVQATLGDWVD